eukprot:13762082-Alexandrium_andersonii.AAC.1
MAYNCIILAWAVLRIIIRLLRPRRVWDPDRGALGAARGMSVDRWVGALVLACASARVRATVTD